MPAVWHRAGASGPSHRALGMRQGDPCAFSLKQRLRAKTEGGRKGKLQHFSVRAR